MRHFVEGRTNWLLMEIVVYHAAAIYAALMPQLPVRYFKN